MAASDYRLCDLCERKAFYDANLNYDWVRPNSGPDLRYAGVPHSGMRLDRMGDWAVLCDECAKTHECKIVPKDQP